MYRVVFIATALFAFYSTNAQSGKGKIDSFRVYGDVLVSIDRPAEWLKNKKTVIVLFALPNGNTTAQTMGKKMQPGDDWHFDIQHIRAQTVFIRRELKKKNVVVVYLENNYKSWPSWKQRHPDFPDLIPKLVDSLRSVIDPVRGSIYLNGHSGGGSFLFGYLAGIKTIPSTVNRISFLDSDYGYDSSYYPKIRDWLRLGKNSALMVFAYNDSIALYNGKPLVSPTGGTWYRSHLLLYHLQQDFSFGKKTTDSLVMYASPDRRIQFYFKINTDRGIYHTQQVELNGFIHSVLAGTKQESRHYAYYSRRAYQRFIE